MVTGTLQRRAHRGVRVRTRNEPTGSTDEASALNGVYQFEITDDDLRAGGITDPGLIAMNHGTFTWTLEDGTWHYEQTASNPEGNAADDGTYSVSGGQATFEYPTLSITEVYGITRADNGDLILTPVVADPVGTLLMTTETWVRVGDVPA